MARRSRKRRRLLPTQVLMFKKVQPWTYAFVEPQRFQPPYTEARRDEIALLYGEFEGGLCYNGPLVCLEGLRDLEEGIELQLSLGCFYDFLACNIVGGAKDDRFLHYCAASGNRHVTQTVEMLMESFRAEQERVRSFEDLAESTSLPNVIAMSALLYDSDGTFLLSKRTGEVVVGQDIFGVTVTGSIEVHDLSAGLDPLCECAARELGEETGIALPDSSYWLRGMATSTDKLQPAALVDVTAGKSLEMREFSPTDVEGKEIDYLVGMDAETVIAAAAERDMTAIAREHCRRSAQAFIDSIEPPAIIKSVDEFFVLPES